eukprot:CAMPEP_0174230298 /NCGR_PEP_ID=MMETSP0417-20130205/1073_1 /TAXON_ID=242541 /ORGANISM="Mayorella sp, Strain BSH-02190019" /LENGTH=1270 /DNA_ID=CAMNT_0015307951 /DNA_START=119 /DNA_END=3931 /DNA_ORIENTATION=+
MSSVTDELDAQIRELQQQKRESSQSGVQLGAGVGYDEGLYGDQELQYDRSITVNDDDDDDDDNDNDADADMDDVPEERQRLRSYTAPQAVLDELANDAPDEDPLLARQNARRITAREDAYHSRRHNRMMTPARQDPFAAAEGADAKQRSYSQVMAEAELNKEEYLVRQQIEKKMQEEQVERAKQEKDLKSEQRKVQKKRKRASRWDAVNDDHDDTGESSQQDAAAARGTQQKSGGGSRWDETPVRRQRRNRWDQTPQDEESSGGQQTPAGSWDATPQHKQPAAAAKKRSRWDATPQVMARQQSGADGTAMMTPGMTPLAGGGAFAGMMTPGMTPLSGMMTPEQALEQRWEREVDARNRPLSDEELDAMLPPKGYKIVEPPAAYVPIRTPARKLAQTPTPMGDSGFFMGADLPADSYGVDVLATPGNLPSMKPEDATYFRKLLVEVDEDELGGEELAEREIMKLLLKIKNGTPPQRKTALRAISTRARDFGPNALFGQILPLLMSPTLEDQERHLLVKVIDRVLYKLDDLVRPWVHKILVVIEPLLIDQDYYARVEGREIISNLAKAAGLATMIANMRPDIDNPDEYVRNTTARAFAVVASALGIPALLPFLKAVCQSKKSWQARHTGIKIVQQIAILMGCATLPHLESLVEIVGHGLKDEQSKVRTITALALASLAEAATPYGIESFDSVLKPLWYGIRQHRGKTLAAFLKAIGFIIPLMDAQYASYYTTQLMVILIREFQSPDEEMKKIVMKVVEQCVATEGVTAEYVRAEILPEFFKHFWQRRTALDARNARQLVQTTEALAQSVGVHDIVSLIVNDLRDQSEPYRRMVLECISKVIGALGAGDIDQRLEEQLVDGMVYAYQEQVADDKNVTLNGFGTVINALGTRAKPYLPQICGTITFRLNNKSSLVRQQAADLITRIAVVMQQCGREGEQLLGRLGVILFEYLGEEYPEVLGSIIGALKSVVNVIGMENMTPPIKDLLPRLTPILKNRHEKVQEQSIDLVGRIADRGPEYVSAREWMRICFDLLEMLKATKKGIRRAAVNTFGYIAKAIGPQDVLATLLNNLKVQERQNRVCTTVAIAIVAETCSPFTVLPALLNEYRVPELNVQNGVLKSLSFMFEYIGEMAKDYIYAVTPLLEKALIDRDQVHRQTASSVVKHIALGVQGLGCEDALMHLLNHVWPNIFETSPHVINAVMEAIEGLRVALGCGVLLSYTLQGLFHPARRVREVYWKIYNGLYIGNPDALVAFAPELPNEAGNTYERTDLALFL